MEFQQFPIYIYRACAIQLIDKLTKASFFVCGVVVAVGQRQQEVPCPFQR